MAILQKIQLGFALALVVASLVPSVSGFQNLNGPAIQKSSSLHMTVLSYNGKKKNFKPGSPLSKALPAIGIRPRYSCKKYVLHCIITTRINLAETFCPQNRPLWQEKSQHFFLSLVAFCDKYSGLLKNKTMQR